MFNNTAIVDRLRMVRWSNHSHPTGVVTGFRARIKLKRLSFNRLISKVKIRISKIILWILKLFIVSKSSRHSAISVKLRRPASFTDTAECLDDFETNF